MQPAPPYQAPRKGGFPTWAIVLLIVGGLVVVFGGIFVMLAVFGVRKYIANAKTAEARNSVAQIGMDAAREYEDEQLDPRGEPTHRVCPSATRSVPTSIAAVSAKKYQSAPGDWTVDAPAHAGFACLKYSMEQPQYYMYSYAATPTSFTATAQGDLNGDGATSSFVLRGEVQPSGALHVEPNIQESNPAE
jgi:type IV pilus assembly protein PilA